MHVGRVVLRLVLAAATLVALTVPTRGEAGGDSTVGAVTFVDGSRLVIAASSGIGGCVFPPQPYPLCAVVAGTATYQPPGGAPVALLLTCVKTDPTTLQVWALGSAEGRWYAIRLEGFAYSGGVAVGNFPLTGPCGTDAVTLQPIASGGFVVA